MLNDKEAVLLQGMIEASPDPNAQYFHAFTAEDDEALERLVYLGLASRKGYNPVQYALTPQGRHYDRDEEERKAVQRAAKKLERREKIVYLVIGALIGAVITKLVDFLYQLITAGLFSPPGQ